MTFEQNQRIQSCARKIMSVGLISERDIQNLLPGQIAPLLKGYQLRDHVRNLSPAQRSFRGIVAAEQTHIAQQALTWWRVTRSAVSDALIEDMDKHGRHEVLYDTAYSDVYAALPLISLEKALGYMKRGATVRYDMQSGAHHWVVQHNGETRYRLSETTGKRLMASPHTRREWGEWTYKYFSAGDLLEQVRNL